VTDVECYTAIFKALEIAEIPCGSYPTPEGWEDERREKYKAVQRAYRALAQLKSSKGGAK